MNVGAVVITYNSAPTLATCLLSLQASSVSDIIVIDNNSQDSSSKIARRFGAQVIKNSNNLGFATACNQGAAYLNHDLILFLNPDASLQPSSLKTAVQFLSSHPIHAAVGLALTSPAGQTEALTSWLSGGALLIRQSAWQAVSGFDEGYFLYWEDRDLCQRLRRAHWKYAHLSHLPVIHQRGASSKSQTLKTRHYDQSADRYFQKHYSALIWIPQKLLRRLYRFWRPLAS